MCEILGGALTGNGCTGPERRFSNGMFSLYVDPGRMDPDGLFPEEVMRYVAYVKSAKPAAPDLQPLVPGEPEERTRRERLAHGVPLAEETWALLIETARSVGLDETRIGETPVIRQ
jgi:uncharacterized oxidoreductase